MAKMNRQVLQHGQRMGFIESEDGSGGVFVQHATTTATIISFSGMTLPLGRRCHHRCKGSDAPLCEEGCHGSSLPAPGAGVAARSAGRRP